MQQVNYYAVIPAEVRYDKDLTPNAKLLYGEISALCNKEGYCWAENSYFAELYDVNIRTIKRWIASLEEKEYIQIRFNDDGNKRRIYLPGVKEISWGVPKMSPPMTKMSPPHDKNVLPPDSPSITGSKAEGQKKSSNTTINNTKYKTEEEESDDSKKLSTKIKSKYSHIFGRKLSPDLEKELLSIIDDENLIEYAILLAEKKAEYPGAYIRKTLEDWKTENLKTIADIEKHLVKLKNKNQQKKNKITTGSMAAKKEKIKIFKQEEYR